MSNARTTRAAPGTPRARQARPEPTVTFMGVKYRIADKVGVWPLMQFARAAEAGLSAQDSRGLSALHAFLQDVIHPDDWGQFQEDMITKKVNDIEPLMEMARQAIELMDKKSANGRGRANGKVVTAEVEE